MSSKSINEQVKLFAAFLNNLAVGSLVGGFAIPALTMEFTKPGGGWWWIGLGLTLAPMLHTTRKALFVRAGSVNSL